MYWSSRIIAVKASATGQTRATMVGSRRVTALSVASVERRPCRWCAASLAMVGVGLTARRTTMAWPVVRPPVMPPALLESNTTLPSLTRIWSLHCEPRHVLDGEPGADLDGLDRADAHHPAEFAVELVEHRLAHARGHAGGDDFDDAAAGIALVADLR